MKAVLRLMSEEVFDQPLPGSDNDSPKSSGSPTKTRTKRDDSHSSKKSVLSQQSSLGSIVEESAKKDEVRDRRRGSLASYLEKRRDSKVGFTDWC